MTSSWHGFSTRASGDYREMHRVEECLSSGTQFRTGYKPVPRRARSFRCVHLLGQLSLEDLSRRGAREIGNDKDLPWHFPLGQAVVAGEVAELVGLDGLAFLGQD